MKKQIEHLYKKNQSDFTPNHGVAIGTNPNRPETDTKIELVIEALRLVNVGDIQKAEKMISKENFSAHDKQWIKAELKTIISFL